MSKKVAQQKNNWLIRCTRNLNEPVGDKFDHKLGANVKTNIIKPLSMENESLFPAFILPIFLDVNERDWAHYKYVDKLESWSYYSAFFMQASWKLSCRLRSLPMTLWYTTYRISDVISWKFTLKSARILLGFHSNITKAEYKTMQNESIRKRLEW